MSSAISAYPGLSPYTAYSQAYGQFAQNSDQSAGQASGSARHHRAAAADQAAQSQAAQLAVAPSAIAPALTQTAVTPSAPLPPGVGGQIDIRA